MTPSQARVVIVFSALLHAGWNAGLRRLQLVHVHAAGPAVLALSFVMAAACLLLFGPLQPLTGAQLRCAAAAGLGEAGYFWTLGPALAAMPLGQAYAWIRGGGMLLVWALSAGLLGEAFTARATAGGVVLLAGLFWPVVPALSAAAAVPKGGVLARLRLPPPSVLGCAAATALYHLSYGEGLAAGAPALPLFCTSMLVALPLLAWGLGRRGLGAAGAALWAAPVGVAWTAALSTAAFALFLLSLRHMGAGTGFALRNTSIVFAQLLSFVGGEPLGGRALLRCALVFAGACLVAAG